MGANPAWGGVREAERALRIKGRPVHPWGVNVEGRSGDREPGAHGNARRPGAGPPGEAVRR